MKYLLPFLLCLSASAADWGVSFFDYRLNEYVRTQAPNTNFEFRTFSTATGTVYLAGLLTQSGMIGDLSGKTLTLRAHLENTGDPQYRVRAYNTWNTGPTPPHFRVFFTTNSNTFSIGTSNGDTLAYWWSQPGAVALGYLSSVPEVTVTLGLSTNLWTAAHGQSSIVESNAFRSALSHVGQIGVTFGGGSFYDVGVACLPGDWTSRFVITEFSVTTPTNSNAPKIEPPADELQPEP